MAFEQTLTIYSAPAAADLHLKQFYAVTIDSSGNLALAAAGKNCDGFLQDKPIQNEVGTIGIFGITKAAITASANIAIGDLLEVDTGGTLKKTVSGTVVGKALEATNYAGITYIAVLMLKTNAVYA